MTPTVWTLRPSFAPFLERHINILHVVIIEQEVRLTIVSLTLNSYTVLAVIECAELYFGPHAIRIVELAQIDSALHFHAIGTTYRYGGHGPATLLGAELGEASRVTGKWDLHSRRAVGGYSPSRDVEQGGAIKI